MKYGISGISGIITKSRSSDTATALLCLSLFPWLIRLVALSAKLSCCRAYRLWRRWYFAAIRELVQIDHSSSVAMRSVWFFLIFRRHTFFMLAIAKVCFWRGVGCILRRAWNAGGYLAAGCFCCMTAPRAVLTYPRCMRLSNIVQARLGSALALITGVTVGFAAYLRLTGTSFFFLQTRKASFEQSFALPLVGIRSSLTPLPYPK